MGFTRKAPAQSEQTSVLSRPHPAHDAGNRTSNKARTATHLLLTAAHRYVIGAVVQATCKFVAVSSVVLNSVTVYGGDADSDAAPAFDVRPDDTAVGHGEQRLAR